MLDNLKKYRIVLASNSPRRKELLAGLGLEFTVRTKSGIDESYPSTLVGDEIPQYISKKKSDAYLPELADDELMITADTIVYCDGQVLGKPKDAADAKRMLRMLSGKTHDVITGVSITTKSLQHIFAVTSKVRFASLSDDEIDYYAYGIQEWIGYIAVEGLEGSYFNVMGLPVQRLYSELKKIQ